MSAKGRDRCEKRTSRGGDGRRLTPCLSPRITAVLPGPRRYNAGTPGPGGPQRGSGCLRALIEHGSTRDG